MSGWPAAVRGRRLCARRRRRQAAGRRRGEQRCNRPAGMLTDHLLPPDQPIVTFGTAYNRTVRPGHQWPRPACRKRGVHATHGFDESNPNGGGPVCRGAGLRAGRDAGGGAQQPEREPAQYTADQADAGLAAYRQNCASCHGENLDDGPFAPPLRGVVFREKWRVRSLEALFTETVTTMPQDRPGSLGDETYTHLMAFPAAGERHRGGRDATGGRPGGDGGAGARLALAGGRAVGRRRPAAGAGAAEPARRPSAR